MLTPSTSTGLLDVVLEKTDNSTKAPPLDVIVYALNGILYPTFLPELMSDFLHLFTMVEFYRIRVVEKAALAIEMNTYYHASSQADPTLPLLTSEQENYLTRLIEKDPDMRKIYMVVITQCCLFVSLSTPAPIISHIHQTQGSQETLAFRLQHRFLESLA